MLGPVRDGWNVHCICTCRVVLCADWSVLREGWGLVFLWALLAEREREEVQIVRSFASCFSLIERDAGLVVCAEVRHWLEIVQCRCLYWGLLAGHCADRVISVCLSGGPSRGWRLIKGSWLMWCCCCLKWNIRVADVYWARVLLEWCDGIVAELCQV